MHLHSRSVWIVMAPTLLVLLSPAFSKSQTTPDQVIDNSTLVYLPAIARNYPNSLPPPLLPRKEGWLRKWQESQEPNYCLEASGTPYYLERDGGEAGWQAAIADTDAVPEIELEVHIDEKVAVTGTLEYFDPACAFPRLNAQKLEVIVITPDGHSGP